MPSPDSTSVIVDEAWKRVLEHWDDPDAHRKFIHICNELRDLSAAGSRYRAVRDADPERRDEAQKRINAIVILATEQLHLMKSPASGPRSTRIFWLALAVSLAILAVALSQFLRAR